MRNIDECSLNECSTLTRKGENVCCCIGTFIKLTSSLVYSHLQRSTSFLIPLLFVFASMSLLDY